MLSRTKKIGTTQSPISFTGLIMAQLSAFILLMSWLYPFSHQYWQQLDTWFFWMMNGSMIDHPNWQYIIVWANYRAADLVPALLTLLLYLHYCFKGKDYYEIIQRIVYGITILILLLITIIIFKFALFEGVLKYFELSNVLPRKSATYMFDNTVRLDLIFPEIRTKVTSKDSFPGDHATVLLFFAVFISYYSGKVYGSLSFLLAFIFIMPRLIGGAHWLSDILVGSISIVLASSSLYLGSSLHNSISDYLFHHIISLLDYIKSRIKIDYS